MQSVLNPEPQIFTYLPLPWAPFPALSGRPGRSRWERRQGRRVANAGTREARASWSQLGIASPRTRHAENHCSRASEVRASKGRTGRSGSRVLAPPGSLLRPDLRTAPQKRGAPFCCLPVSWNQGLLKTPASRVRSSRLSWNQSRRNAQQTSVLGQKLQQHRRPKTAQAKDSSGPSDDTPPTHTFQDAFKNSPRWSRHKATFTGQTRRRS